MKHNVATVIVLVVAAIVIIAFSSVFTVYQTQQALVLELGKPVRIIKHPGLEFKLPFIEDVVDMDKRILALQGPTEEVIAADQKRLLVDSFARFRITDPLEFYQTVGSEAVARSRLGSLLNSALRQVLGSQDFQAALSGERGALMLQIRDIMQADARRFGIEVVDVRIRRTDLPEANSLAIQGRMQTEREREAKQNRAEGAEIATRIRADADRQRTILLAEAQKTAEILRGEGDAEQTRILGQAIEQDPEFYAFYRSLQAYRTALTGSNTTLVLTPDSQFFRYFNGIPGTNGVGGGLGAASPPPAPPAPIRHGR